MNRIFRKIRLITTQEKLFFAMTDARTAQSTFALAQLRPVQSFRHLTPPFAWFRQQLGFENG